MFGQNALCTSKKSRNVKLNEVNNVEAVQYTQHNCKNEKKVFTCCIIN